MSRLLASLCLILALSGCAKAQYQAAQTDLLQMRQQCVAAHGGTNINQLRSVPRENIVAATECYNQAEIQTLVPVYGRWGFNAATTYQKQAAQVELARKRAAGEISADDFAAISIQLERLAEADLRNQDAAHKQQRAAAAREFDSQMRAIQVQEAQKQNDIVNATIANRPKHTSCQTYGNTIQCREW